MAYHLEAGVSDLEKLIPEVRSFAKRPESWVAVKDELFFKVPRLREELGDDLNGAANISMAEAELRASKYLAAMDSNVLEPLGVSRACLIYRAISGPDLRDALLGDNFELGQCGLLQAMGMLGRLHSSFRRSAVEMAEYGVTSPFFVTPTERCRRLMQVRAKSIVIDGFEVRNFRFDSRRRAWIFFDPHRIRIGPAECDVARFIVSLLMLRWGRSVRCWTWTRFNVKELLRTYEEESGCELDSDLIQFFLAENVAMREHYALLTIKDMSTVVKPLAMAYRNVFFLQTRNWVAKNGL